ncbi:MULTISPECIES: hypothetical protein [Thermodesulfovibrio]|uniref:Lipoprotein n=1 Tax=Thermodesulfovibrio yellowstonii TaxID=28262 RepID=A0A9W6LKF3_9BACT|nr:MULTISPECIES: hypothetical protein [Thermodesulfovibrio]GLI54181.1 hypothetical protein TISLANDTSLP1_18740 [Thermodesulfovibrio islandicus]
MKRFLIIFLTVLFFSSCIFIDYSFSQPQPQIQASKDKLLQYAKPKKPVKIKLHRDKKGEYSWDITGENADEIIRADKRLRQLLKEE